MLTLEQGEEQREMKRKSQAGFMPSVEPNIGLNLTNLRS